MEMLYHKFRSVCPEPEPEVFHASDWTKPLPAIHFATVMCIVIGGSETSAIVATGDLWPISPILIAECDFGWSRELHAMVNIFKRGDPVPDFDTTAIENFGWQITSDTYDELEFDGSQADQ